MGEKRNTHNILTGKSEGIELFRELRNHGWIILKFILDK
jgi:hypothetical protein